MKSYTDLEQSRKLAEFLPIESADCYWDYDEIQKFHRISWFEDGYNKESQLMFNENNVCAWSLTALMAVIPSGKALIHDRGNLGYECICNNIDTYFHDNPIDACVAMIKKLHELNLL